MILKFLFFLKIRLQLQCRILCTLFELFQRILLNNFILKNIKIQKNLLIIYKISIWWKDVAINVLLVIAMYVMRMGV